MPPRKATAAQKGKARIEAGETSQAPRVTRASVQPALEDVPPSSGSVTPPLREDIRAAGATNRETVPPRAPEVPVPEPPAPQAGAEGRAMRDAVQLLTTLMAEQVRRPGFGGGRTDRYESSRAREFLTCGPPEFSGTKFEEDPQEFVRKMESTLQLIKASSTESVELASYRLHEVAANWYESWQLSRGNDAPPAVWAEFTRAFLDHFLPPELRRARVDRFLNLRQNGRSVREYSLEFDSLARYAPTIVADMADRVHRYVMGLDSYLIDGCLAVAAQPGMHVARVQAHAQGMEDRRRERRPDRGYDRGRPKRARSAGYSEGFQGEPSKRQGNRYPSQPAYSTPPQFSGQNPMASSSRVDGSFSQMGPSIPRCPHCRRRHPGECYRATGACYSCGQQGHTMRECPYRGGPGGSTQLTGSVTGSSPPLAAMRPAGRGAPAPAPAGRGRGRGAASGYSGPSNRVFALTGRQDPGASSSARPGTPANLFEKCMYG